MTHADTGLVTRVSQYVELHCHSAFSMLDGAALPETLVARATQLGYPALALTDHDELGGAVRFAQAGSELGVQAIIGAEITIEGGQRTADSGRGARSPMSDIRSPAFHHLVLLAETREGYGNLSTLITLARMHSARGEPRVDLDTLARHARGSSRSPGARAAGFRRSRRAATSTRRAKPPRRSSTSSIGASPSSVGITDSLKNARRHAPHPDRARR